MDNNLKRSIILEHYQHPKHKGLIEDNTYMKANMNNESCIDEINLMLKIENDKVVDAKFDGEACAICTSSASIMTDMLIGKNINEVEELLTNFSNMIDEKDYDAEKLNEAIVYDEIAKQPNRKKCALLPWGATEKILKELKK